MNVSQDLKIILATVFQLNILNRKLPKSSLLNLITYTPTSLAKPGNSQLLQEIEYFDAVKDCFKKLSNGTIPGLIHLVI